MREMIRHAAAPTSCPLPVRRLGRLMCQDEGVIEDDLPDEGAWETFAPEAESRPTARRSWDALIWVAIGLGILTAIGLIVLRPTGEARDRSSLAVLGVPSELHAAEIVAVTAAACPGAEQLACTTVDFRIAEGPDLDQVYTQSFPPSALNPDFAVGDVAILSRRTPNGRVTSTASIACPWDPSATCRELGIEIVDDASPRSVTYVAAATEAAMLLSVGDEAIVEFFPDDLETVLTAVPPDVDIAYQFTGDFQRRPVLLAAALVFAAAVIGVGWWRGVAALAGLTASLGVLLLFVLPAILDGRSPVLVAVVGAAAIAFVTLYLAHGFTRMTTVALVGMVAALVLTALLSAGAVELAQFSGFSTEESTLLSVFEGIDVAGILLAGIVLGAAGALDDVTVTQASAVWELADADPQATPRSLLLRGMRIGRAHVASTVNTLALAYVGATLPLFLVFSTIEVPFSAAVSLELVAQEIVRGLVGCLGILLAVPVTTGLAVLTARAGSSSSSTF